MFSWPIWSFKLTWQMKKSLWKYFEWWLNLNMMMSHFKVAISPYLEAKLKFYWYFALFLFFFVFLVCFCSWHFSGNCHKLEFYELKLLPRDKISGQDDNLQYFSIPSPSVPVLINKNQKIYDLTFPSFKVFQSILYNFFTCCLSSFYLIPWTEEGSQLFLYCLPTPDPFFLFLLYLFVFMFFRILPCSPRESFLVILHLLKIYLFRWKFTTWHFVKEHIFIFNVRFSMNIVHCTFL